jgi:tetratricopeptide (TPR) repeat protein
MSKTNRNDPCPCGSGRKYKRCCQPKTPSEQPKKPARDIPKRARLTPSSYSGFLHEDKLDTESNLIVDLIHQNRLDEAETAAQMLLQNYPEVHDGIERLAMVYEARGDRPRAIEMYEKSLQFTLTHEGYDEEMREYYRNKISQLKNSDPNQAGRS